MRKLYLLTICVLVVTIGYPQSIDESFHPKMLAYASIFNTTPMPDGKVFIVGDIHYFNGTPVSYFVKANADGTIDDSFNVGSGSYGSLVREVVPYDDDRVLVIGTFAQFNEASRMRIVRLHENGSVDDTFTSPFQQEDIIYGADVQSDGKIIVSGGVLDGDMYTPYLKRLNEDGTIDATFETPAFSGGHYIMKIQVLPDDDILVAGNIPAYNSETSVNHFFRLNADGSFDGSFSAGFAADFNGYTMNFLVLPDGTMFVHRHASVVKLEADGSVDETFAPASPINNFSGTMVLQSDGSLVTAYQTHVSKLSVTGVSLGSIDVANNAGNVYSLGNDKLLSGSRGSEPYTSHIGLNADLSVNESWSPSLMLYQATEVGMYDGLHFLQQPDGKFVGKMYSPFYTKGDVNDVHKIDQLFRLNTDFSVDGMFAYESPANADHKLVHIDEAGNIYVTRTGAENSLIRLNPEGEVDELFHPVPGYFNNIAKIDGSNFVGVTGQRLSNVGKIMKFSDEGEVDPMINFSLNGPVNTVDVASDGDWYITIPSWSGAGILNGVEVKKVIKMNPDGTLDAAFALAQSTFPSPADAIVLDKQIFVVGTFDRPLWTYTTPIERYNFNGEPSLNYDNLLKNKQGLDMVIAGDHIFLLTFANGKHEIQRLTINGNVDRRFKAINYRSVDGPSPEAGVQEVFVLEDGSLMIVGDRMYHIVIPEAPVDKPTDLAVNVFGNGVATLTWADNSDDESVFEIERSEDGVEFYLWGVAEENQTTYNDSTLADGKSYTYRVVAANAGGATEPSNEADTGMVLGVLEINAGWKIFPSPVRDQLNIESNEVIERFSLMQIDGRLLGRANPRSNDFKINMTDYASGLYILQLESATKRKTFKIFKN